jgi:farnesyl diphosphate synthase
MTPSFFEQHLHDTSLIIGQTLDHLLSPVPQASERRRPQRLIEAMRYACLNAGKRLRPFLVVHTAQLFQPASEGVLRVACAFECVHCYSLIHDDLPAMDDDDLRRGLPTLHKAFDEATAILAGDGLLTLAFDILADPITHHDPAIRANLVLLLARASGIGGMVGGQILDLGAEAATLPLSAASIEELQAMKTGALLQGSVEAGALIAGADAQHFSALSAYGRAIGAAFQIADDLLDAVGDAQRIGKRIGKDAQRNKATLVSHFGIDEARRHCAALVDEAITALAPFGEQADVLRHAAAFIGQRQH